MRKGKRFLAASLICMAASMAPAFLSGGSNALKNGIIGGNNVVYASSDSETTEEDPVQATIVTPEDFFNYFDESGALLASVTDEKICFQGDFSEIGVNYIIIDHSISIVGDEASFDGVTFTVLSDNVTIDGLDISQDSDVYGILID